MRGQHVVAGGDDAQVDAASAQQPLLFRLRTAGEPVVEIDAAMVRTLRCSPLRQCRVDAGRIAVTGHMAAFTDDVRNAGEHGIQRCLHVLSSFFHILWRYKVAYGAAAYHPP